MKKFTIAVLIISLFIAFTIYVPLSFYPLNNLLLNLLEKRLEAKIAYRSLKIYLWRSLTAEGIEALGKGGFGLSAEKGSIDYDLMSIITGRLHLVCELENVKFYKGSSIINSLSDILHMQPLGNVTFKSIEGNIFVGRFNTLTQDLTLLSDKIKIFGNAVTDRDDNIMCLLYFFMKDDLVNEIPEEIRDSLLHKEEGPWSSIYVGIMGNYKKPLLRIITDRFRMNISSK